MEVHLAGSTEDRLLSSLHFDGKRSANYVTGRSEVSYPSSSGGSFSPSNGIRVMRFSLSDSSGFLSGDTVRLSFVIHNNGTQPLTPITASPCSMFRRLRITASGVEVEDLEFLSRYVEMRQMLKSSDEKITTLSRAGARALALRSRIRRTQTRSQRGPNARCSASCPPASWRTGRRSCYLP
jgi:hypothetical protein